MALYFECRARYNKVMENGLVKKVTEAYLVDALTHSEAEARFIEEVTPYISGEFEVSVVKKTKIAEIFNPHSDKFYLVKVGFITLDEKTGQKKRSISQILVGANDFDEALQIFKDGMKGSVVDYEIVSLSETQILEVFPAKLA